MSDVVAEKVIQATETQGLGDIELADGAEGQNRTWRSQFADGAKVIYHDRRVDGSKWEQGAGTLTYGTTGNPDTISRDTILASSDGGTPINWQSTDVPRIVYSPSSNIVADHLVTEGKGSAAPAWLPVAGRWTDVSAGLAVRWIRKLRTAITPAVVETEEGRYEATKGIYVPSPRRPWENVGAANKTVTANHIGWCFKFDTTAAVRTVSLPDVSTLDVGFTFDVIGTGAYNGVALVPNSNSDSIMDLLAGATFTTLPRTRFSVTWDGERWNIGGHVSMLGQPIRYMGDTLPSGHVWGNGTTIGDATSGAGRANLDTFLLFKHLWDVALLGIYTSAGAGSTRGATALDDWNAHKRLAVPDHRELSDVGKSTMGGLAARGLISVINTSLLANAWGTVTHGHTITVGATLDTLTMTTTDGSTGAVTAANAAGNSVSASGHTHGVSSFSGTIGASGSASSGDHTPPILVSNVIYRLY